MMCVLYPTVPVQLYTDPSHTPAGLLAAPIIYNSHNPPVNETPSLVNDDYWKRLYYAGTGKCVCCMGVVSL